MSKLLKGISMVSFGGGVLGAYALDVPEEIIIGSVGISMICYGSTILYSSLKQMYKGLE